MYVTVNGARLFFDVEGLGLVPETARACARSRPCCCCTAGRASITRSTSRHFSQLADIAQIIYYDHRGQGRSGGEDRATWNLAQWGDDVKGLCDALGIVKPIVVGVSFGGLRGAVLHDAPSGSSGEGLSRQHLRERSSTRRYSRCSSASAARLRAISPSLYWLEPTMERRLCLSGEMFPALQQHAADDPVRARRAVLNHNMGLHFNGPRNEQGRMDFRADLARVTCPVLVTAGDMDPIVPMSLTDIMVEHLPKHLTRYERFRNVGHGVHRDEPERAFALLREFILELNLLRARSSSARSPARRKISSLCSPSAGGGVSMLGPPCANLNAASGTEKPPSTFVAPVCLCRMPRVAICGSATASPIVRTRHAGSVIGLQETSPTRRRLRVSMMASSSAISRAWSASRSSLFAFTISGIGRAAATGVSAGARCWRRSSRCRPWCGTRRWWRADGDCPWAADVCRCADYPVRCQTHQDHGDVEHCHVDAPPTARSAS